MEYHDTKAILDKGKEKSRYLLLEIKPKDIKDAVFERGLKPYDDNQIQMILDMVDERLENRDDVGLQIKQAVDDAILQVLSDIAETKRDVMKAKYNREKMEQYLIDCLGYSIDDCRQMTGDEIQEFIDRNEVAEAWIAGESND